MFKMPKRGRPRKDDPRHKDKGKAKADPRTRGADYAYAITLLERIAFQTYSGVLDIDEYLATIRRDPARCKGGD